VNVYTEDSTSECLYRRFQFSSVAQSCPTLCDPMSCSTPGLPAHHQLLECIHSQMHFFFFETKDGDPAFSLLSLSMDSYSSRPFQRPATISVYRPVSSKSQFCSVSSLLAAITLDLCFCLLHIETAWRKLLISLSEI